MPVDTSSMKNMPAMEEEAGSASRRFVGAGGNPGIVVRISWNRHPLSKVVRYTDSPELECFHRIGLVTDHKKGI